MQFNVGRRLVGRTWLICLDGRTETVFICHIIDMTVNTVGVRVAVATCSFPILIAVLFVVLGAAVAIINVIAPCKRHWWMLKERVQCFKKMSLSQ